MNSISDVAAAPTSDMKPDLAPFFIRGKVVDGADQIHRSRDLGVDFATPKIDLDSLVHPRTELPPLLNTPISEIIDFLYEAGQKLADPNNPHIQGTIDRIAKVSLQPRLAIQYQLQNAIEYLDRARSARWSSRTSPIRRRWTSGCRTPTIRVVAASSALFRRV